MSAATPRLVLAFSGGPTSSAGISWLADRFNAEVVTVTLDVGQGGELAAVRERALAAGAVRAHVLDARDEFARSYIVPSLQAGALFATGRPPSIELTRPLVARQVVRVAGMEHASGVAHGGDSSLARCFDSVAEGLTVVALPRDSRQRVTGFPPPEVPPHSRGSLWGRWVVADQFVLTTPLSRCPDAAAHLDITFERGVPVAVNGITMGLVELLSSLDTIAGAHGVGRFDSESASAHGTAPAKAEAPAAVTLHAALADLQAQALSTDLARFLHHLRFEYVDLVSEGRWFSPLRPVLDAAVAHVQSRVTGTVRLRLWKGLCSVVERRMVT